MRTQHRSEVLASLASGYSQLGTRTPISRQPAACSCRRLRSVLPSHRVRGFSLLSAEASERSDTPRAALVPEGHTGIVPPKCCLSWDSASLTG